MADDYGRFDANPAVLLGRCVPTLGWSFRKVEKCLEELTRIVPGDEIPAVQLYAIKERIYGFLTTWTNHQRDRSKDANPPKPKFPDPKDGKIISPQPAAKCSNLPQSAALTESESEDGNENETVRRTTPQNAAGVFDAVWSQYPNKSGKEAAKKAWTKFMLLGISVDIILVAIEKQKKTEQWVKDGGKFIPHFSSWLNGKRWEDEVVPAHQANRPPAPPPKIDPIARGQWTRVYGDPKKYGYD